MADDRYSVAYHHREAMARLTNADRHRQNGNQVDADYEVRAANVHALLATTAPLDSNVTPLRGL